jgi:hypothetical protein
MINGGTLLEAPLYLLIGFLWKYTRPEKRNFQGNIFSLALSNIKKM